MAETSIPQLRVQRMGKRFRIVYAEGRNLAKFESGLPLDDGGFLDEFEDGVKTVDGELACQQLMVKITTGQKTADPEAEGIGN